MPLLFRSQQFVLIVFLFGLGCATNRSLTQTGSNGAGKAAPVFQVALNTPLILINPKVVVEDARSGSSLGDFSRDSWIYQDLISKSKNILAQKHFTQISQALELTGLSEAQTNAAHQLAASSHRLLRANPAPELRQDLQSLGTTAESSAALFHYVRVKRGPSGSWDPNTGAITSAASSTYFQAALVDCQTGKILWENSVLLREVPAPGERNFAQAITLLFANLNPESSPKE
jgi:hypothetical protein